MIALCLLVAADVHISWDYDKLALPMELYEVATSRPVEVWDTGHAPSLEELPVGEKIADDTFEMDEKSGRTFVLVMHNPGKAPVAFFAAPHVVHPAEHSLGFKFQCLCINHVFVVPPGEYWYRIVKLLLFKGFRGKALDVRHSLVAVDAKDATRMAVVDDDAELVAVQPGCKLHRDTARKLEMAVFELKERGLKLHVHACAGDGSAAGARGASVSVSLEDELGQALPAQTKVGDRSKKAARNVKGLPPAVEAKRDLLELVMVRNGFYADPTAWYRFEDASWRHYRAQ